MNDLLRQHLEEVPVGVHLDGPRNSTMFTDCCGCAINDREGQCPRCNREVIPAESRWSWAYRKQK